MKWLAAVFASFVVALLTAGPARADVAVRQIFPSIGLNPK